MVRGWYPVVGALASALAVPLALAGPLNPPAGPITSTAKPLAEVEPRTAINAANTPGDASSVFRIIQPGSYYLTGNVTGVTGKYGIVIAASNVSVDLNGFAVLGAASTFTGIFSSSPANGVTVRNGSVSGWTTSGIDLNASAGTLIENVVVRGNTGFGVRTGTQGVIRFCSCTSNTTTGIAVFQGGVVESCNAAGNGSIGISAGFGSVVRSCLARENTSGGINVNGEAVVSDCTAYNNGGTGISAGSLTLVERCTSSFNIGTGISAGAGCTVRGNLCGNNSGASGFGVAVTGADNRVEDNNCTSNTRGVDVSSAGNIVARNVCSGNSINWNIVSGNAVAPIVNASTNGALISGNTYAGSLGGTDPNSNFTY
jgi:parallel beta-helix repeat protein